jgi:chromate transporter
MWLPFPFGGGVIARVAILAQEAAPITLSTLFLTFLKIGAVLYGSGYVLVAFLQTEFVERLGWITSGQLLDAVAIGQFTPGPVFTTATFIGYLVAGVPGAIVATIGIFLPSFIFVAITNPFIPRMRRSPWLAALLDGVVVASLGLMAAVTVDLARQSIIDIPTILIALVAAVLLIRFRVNSTWLIIGGAVVGLAVSQLL